MSKQLTCITCAYLETDEHPVRGSRFLVARSRCGHPAVANGVRAPIDPYKHWCNDHTAAPGDRAGEG